MVAIEADDAVTVRAVCKETLIDALICDIPMSCLFFASLDSIVGVILAADAVDAGAFGVFPVCFTRAKLTASSISAPDSRALSVAAFAFVVLSVSILFNFVLNVSLFLFNLSVAVSFEAVAARGEENSSPGRDRLLSSPSFSSASVSSCITGFCPTKLTPETSSSSSSRASSSDRSPYRSTSRRSDSSSI